MGDFWFDRLLVAAVKKSASDIHLRVASPPALRIDGQLFAVRLPALEAEDLDEIVAQLIPDGEVRNQIGHPRDVDLSYRVEGLGRFRVNVFRSGHHFALVLRVIPAVIPTLESLGLPSVMATVCAEPHGLVLVTGATGSGKTTTLAAMVDHVNAGRRGHIITIEDPIEYVHEDKMATVTQREIGTDADDFANALRGALRQDPDVILVGEMRDLETMEVALKAAETGHLVLSTLHTADAASTIARVIGVYPPDTHHALRARLAATLRAVVCQRLLIRKDGKGRILATEILVVTDAIRDFVRDDRLDEIPDYLAKQRDAYGTQSFDQHLAEMVEQDLVTLDVARAASTRPNDFMRSMLLE